MRSNITFLRVERDNNGPGALHHFFRRLKIFDTEGQTVLFSSLYALDILLQNDFVLATEARLHKTRRPHQHTVSDFSLLLYVFSNMCVRVFHFRG